MDAIVTELYMKSPVASKLSDLAFCFIGPSKHFFYTLPSEYGRPIHLISVPHRSIRNLWNWLVIPHEIGHDIFIDVPNLSNEIEHIVTKALEPFTLSTGLARVPRWNSSGRQVMWKIITGTQLLREIWTEWSFELFPDIFATLLCGPAYVMQLQEVLQLAPICSWTMYPTEGHLGAPGPHPVGHIRSLMLTSILRKLNFDHYADALDERLSRTTRAPSAVSWFFRSSETAQPIMLFEAAFDEKDTLQFFDFYAATASQYYAPVALGIWAANWEMGCKALGIQGHFAMRSEEEQESLPRYDLSWVLDGDL